MNDDLEALKTSTDAALAAATDLRAWDAVRIAVLGRNGSLTAMLRDLGKVPPEQKKERGAALNRLKDALNAAIDGRKIELEEAALDARLLSERIDPTLPPRPRDARADPPDLPHHGGDRRDFRRHGLHRGGRSRRGKRLVQLRRAEHPGAPPRAGGSRHLLSAAPRDGNAPPVLRTHTSPGQIRTMLAQEPPIRVIVTGRTYRADHDATHSPMFHQCEGLVIDRGMTLGHLKGVLIDFLRTFFAISDLPVRFRSSYFPVHRTLDGGGYRLGPQDRRTRPRRRLAGDPGQRHGASARAGQLRHRPAGVAGFRLGHGRRAHHHAEARDGRSAAVL